MGQKKKKEKKQNWKGTKKGDFTLCSASNQLPDFSGISWFFMMPSFRSFGNLQSNSFTKFILLQSLALHVANKAYTTMLHCFLISFL